MKKIFIVFLISCFSLQAMQELDSDDSTSDTQSSFESIDIENDTIKTEVVHVQTATSSEKWPCSKRLIVYTLGGITVGLTGALIHSAATVETTIECPNVTTLSLTADFIKDIAAIGVGTFATISYATWAPN